MKQNLLYTLLFLMVGSQAFAQISGVVKDQNGEELIGVHVTEKGTLNGTLTGLDGSFTLNPKSYPANIQFRYVGYDNTEMIFTEATSGVQVMISEGIALDEIVVTGTRGNPRTILDSPVPIDNINADALVATGKTQIDQMLNYKVPSFNSQNQAISDATAHYDPADLRGLGPSRTLVLVNGKRKNQSAQVYLNRTPGKGEVGVDLKSIPAAALDHIEVLRDGASAQYGSDAIAGVINMILKKDVEYTTASVRSGVTSEGDGYHLSADINTSLNLGKGFINVTAGYFNQQITNRAGNVTDTNAQYADWLAATPTAGMIVGQPAMEKFDIFMNMEQPLSETANFYTFHGMTTRTGQSFAYYRAPYWRGDVAAAEHFTPAENFVGYHPTFETDIDDNIDVAGIDWKMGNLNADASITYGRNEVNYTVNRSVNRDYLADHGWSPSTFKPGGYIFNNIIGNVDFNTNLGGNEDTFLGFGFELKKERFRSLEGDYFSYYKGGSDSFAGIKPEEVVDEDRTSKAAYVTLDYDITDALLIGAAARLEDYSDFGDNFSWKINARYKLGEKGALRASYSTGFRAPTLHQRHLINSQYIIVQGSPDPQLQGTLANNNPAVVALGVPNLFAETSKNLTAGLTYKLSNKVSASIDYYNIAVDDRILFSSQISSSTPGDAVDNILQANGVKAVQFFINAGDTKTSGVDFVLNFDNIKVGSGNSRFGGVIAANFNESTIDNINTPGALESGGYDIFDRREQSLITLSRPKSKVIVGLHYQADKFRIGLDNTRFGEVTVTAASGPADDQEHSAKMITDFSINYDLNDFIQITGNINNIFDVYPDELRASTGEDGGGRFVYSSIVQQQNFLGTNFVIGVNMKFAK